MSANPQTVITVIFDLDGTLIDSMKAFSNLVINNLRQRGVKTTEEVLNKVGKGLLEDFQTVSSKQGFGLIPRLFWNIGRKSGLSRPIALFFALKCLSQARKVYNSAPLFPDAKEALTRLKNAGYKLGVYTMASRNQLLASLIKHDIIHFFDAKVLISRDDVKQLKPDPEGISLALSKFSTHPSRSFYIGDMPIDIIAGNRAGVTTIGLTTGLVNREIFQQYCEPAIIFDSLEQVTHWISNTNSRLNPDSKNEAKEN
ncbi:MAG: HAD family hydrolase [Candidatus Hodarchaeales archaeon]|jgi:pyrophosphatase PpaX